MPLEVLGTKTLKLEANGFAPVNALKYLEVATVGVRKISQHEYIKT